MLPETVLSATTLDVVAKLPTGRGQHEIAFSDDSALAFISNADDGTVSIIDVRELTKLTDLETGQHPVSVAFSPMAGMAIILSPDSAAKR